MPDGRISLTPEQYQRIGALFDEALEQAPEQRSAWLQQACGADLALYSAVEDLLAHHNESEEFLDRPAMHVAANLLAQQPAAQLVGQQIGHYQIRSLLGAGGMGQVYQARDTRLDRAVAIKVLPNSFTSDPDRLRRFELEAKATGALNHPNILTIHDTGAHEGTPYIVTELLEGTELGSLLSDGPLPLRQALDYARQIAQGLAAAHEKGITHRDLKPANIFVTTEGRIKILDFGLAKLNPVKLVGSTDAETVTQTPNTEPGVVMGTVGYMSPEQVRGQAADHRSDIFSFGIILYEMLTGRRAFQGESFAEVMAAIVKDDPLEISAANPQIPLSLAHVTRHCLEKRPERRFQTASDLGFAIEAVAVFSDSQPQLALMAAPESEPEKPGTTIFKRERLMWAALSLLLAAGLIATWFFLRKPSAETRVTRLSIPLPKDTGTASSQAPDLALSPDGGRLVFSAITGKTRQLWLRSLDSFTTQPLAGTEGADSPFWSPDGNSIAFFADNKLKKIDTRSNVIEIICPAGSGRGGDWSRDGIILFCAGDGAALSRVDAAGGKPEVATELDTALGEINHDYPSFLPDGQHYLFHLFGKNHHGIYVGSLKSKERKLLIPLSPDSANATRAMWSASDSGAGYILYALNRNTLLARAFDPDRLEFQGEPFRVAENVIVSLTGNARFTTAANGTLAYLQNREMDVAKLTWCDRSGKRLSEAGTAEPWTSFALSPDDAAVALIRNEPNRLNSLWQLNLAQGTTTRVVTDTDSANFFPVWSPDGEQLAFASARNSALNLYLKRTTGNAPEERLLETRFQTYPLSWSPDGKVLIYAMGDPQTRTDIWALPLSGSVAGERKPQPLLQTKFDERAAKVSPDGHWLAYVSDETGTAEIYVTTFPQPGRAWRISKSGGNNPAWRADGKELFYLAGRQLMAASVSGSGTEFQSSAPQPLFEIEGANYAVSRDGQRFLTSVVTERAPTPPINVALNWTAEVKK
ncbi:MAG: serine/threonine-protein kinase [Blastocatellia bacterium]|nr:serine/threonine-protein kinase [Blastocatellia bacterium]